MKFRLLLLTAGCAMSAFGAYAQKGVDNGTRFGSGEDSIRCITNISLFAPYAKAGNYKDAYEPWKAAYTECPAATKDIYLYGVKIMEWLIKNETDATKKAALIDDLMAVYDQRVKYFGDDKRYRKDWIVARKAQDYMQYKGTESDYAKVYGWLKEVVDEFGNSTDPLAVSSFAFASMRVMMADPNKQEQYIQDYLKASDILNSQLKAAEAAGSETTVKNLNIYISGMEDAFAASGAADCETLQNLYADKIEQNCYGGSRHIVRQFPIDAQRIAFLFPLFFAHCRNIAFPYGINVKWREPVERDGENARLVFGEVILPIRQQFEVSDAFQRQFALVLQFLLSGLNSLVHPCGGFVVADVVSLHVRLHEQPVVDRQ